MYFTLIKEITYSWNRSLMCKTLLHMALNTWRLTACTECTLLPLLEEAYQTNWLINLTYYGISDALTFVWPPWRLIWPWSPTRWKKPLKLIKKLPMCFYTGLANCQLSLKEQQLSESFFPYDGGKRTEQGNCEIAAGDWVSSFIPLCLSARRRKNSELKYLDNTDHLIPENFVVRPD